MRVRNVKRRESAPCTSSAGGSSFASAERGWPLAPAQRAMDRGEPLLGEPPEPAADSSARAPSAGQLVGPSDLLLGRAHRMGMHPGQVFANMLV